MRTSNKRTISLARWTKARTSRLDDDSLAAQHSPYSSSARRGVVLVDSVSPSRASAPRDVVARRTEPRIAKSGAQRRGLQGPQGKPILPVSSFP